MQPTRDANHSTLARDGRERESERAETRLGTPRLPTPLPSLAFTIHPFLEDRSAPQSSPRTSRCSAPSLSALPRRPALSRPSQPRGAYGARPRAARGCGRGPRSRGFRGLSSLRSVVQERTKSHVVRKTRAWRLRRHGDSRARKLARESPGARLQRQSPPTLGGPRDGVPRPRKGASASRPGSAGDHGDCDVEPQRWRPRSPALADPRPRPRPRCQGQARGSGRGAGGRMGSGPGGGRGGPRRWRGRPRSESEAGTRRDFGMRRSPPPRLPHPVPLHLPTSPTPPFPTQSPSASPPPPLPPSLAPLHPCFPPRDHRG